MGQGTGCEPAGNSGGVWGHRSRGMGSVFPMLRAAGPRLRRADLGTSSEPGEAGEGNSEGSRAEGDGCFRVLSPSKPQTA